MALGILDTLSIVIPRALDDLAEAIGALQTTLVAFGGRAQLNDNGESGIAQRAASCLAGPLLADGEGALEGIMLHTDCQCVADMS